MHYKENIKYNLTVRQMQTLSQCVVDTHAVDSTS